MAPTDPEFPPRSFLISIDTEGDDVWSRPKKAGTRNAEYLPRFQALCERFGFKPTYLVNHEMALCATFQAFGREVLARGAAEIGMHLHPWDSPPLDAAIGPDDWRDQPYPCEYPDDALDRKIVYLTRLLRETFDTPIMSHRAGRFGFSEAYCRSLIRLGYRVDCSVTPHVSWRNHPGAAGGNGGPDYREFPEEAYFLDPADIARPGSSSLLEVPTTILVGRRPIYKEIARRLLGRRDPRLSWLRPDGHNLSEMLEIVERVGASERSYLQFTLHSSEFMPGGSPTFRTGADIERLYDHLGILFAAIGGAGYEGRSLTEFAEGFFSRAGGDTQRPPSPFQTR